MSIFDWESLEQQLRKLEQEMASPVFWDNQDRAREVSQQAERTRSILTTYRSLIQETDDIATLCDLAVEMDDQQEMLALDSRLPSLEKHITAFRREIYFSGKHDMADCYLSINAGAGGTDSQDWAEMLLRMYGRWCERSEFGMTLLEASPGEEAGIRSATLEIKGKYAYGNLKGDKGVHRLVRISPFDSANRRHTSFAAVSVVPITEEQELRINPKDLRIDTYRSSGAGGQHVNVTDSAVRITHLPTKVVVSCQNERSQRQNKETAMKVLRSRLAELLRRQEEQELEELQGQLRDIEWGSQIRSYVLHPYQMVKDHRTEVQVGNVDAVLDGDIDVFLEAFLEQTQK